MFDYQTILSRTTLISSAEQTLKMSATRDYAALTQHSISYPGKYQNKEKAQAVSFL